MKSLAALLLLGLLPACLAQNEPAAHATSDKKIHANDLLSITVLDEPELTRTVRVDSEGAIRLPYLTDGIQAEGLLPEQLEKSISDSLKAGQILLDPFVAVTVAESYRPLRPPISVIGSVRNPITFQSVEPVALLEALTRAGGVSADAGPEILITPARLEDAGGGHSGAFVKRIRVKSLVDSSDPDANLLLTGGEEIRVPEGGRIYIFGNVKKPGMLTVEESADATVFKALAISEGLAPYAARQAYIFRRESGTNSRSEISVNLKQIVEHKVPDPLLLPNDILYVPDNSRQRDTVSILKMTGAAGLVAFSAILYVILR